MRVIDQLKTLKTGYQWAEHKPTKYFSFDTKPLPFDTVPNKNPVYETTAWFKVRQVGSSKRMEDFELKLIHEQAAHSVARELYGDIVERLYKVVDILYEDGPKYDDEVLKEISSLIDDLQLRDNF